jgi:hypothetical protein
MSEAKAEAQQRTIQYLIRLVQMNPAVDGEGIIRARSTALGLVQTDAALPQQNGSDYKERRRKLLEDLEAIRTGFWTLPLDELQSKLSQLDAHEFADLEPAIAQLKVVAAHRGRFPKLSEHKDFDEQFFSLLKNVLVRSPRETAVLREQVLSMFRDRHGRKKGRRMIALLKKEMRPLYELEADWFESLQRQKTHDPAKHIVVGGRRVASASTSGNFRYVWLLGFVIMAVVRALTSYSDNDHSTHRPYSIPNYQPSYQLRDIPQSALPPVSSGEARAPRESLSKPFVFTPDKDVWKPFPNDASPSTSEHQSQYPSIGAENPFTTPRSIVPFGSSNHQDDRYSR